MLKNLILCAGLMCPIAAATATAAAGSAQPASAPVSVDRYVVVHTTEGVPVRSGGATIYYPIAFPKPGDLLAVDGETSGWLRVGYPAGVRPFVSAEDAEIISAGVVRLNKPSRLRAPNANSGLKGAFQPVVESPLNAGTDLTGAEAIKDDEGKTVAYAVDAPAAARGWISRDAVRRATDAEAAPLLARLGPAEPAAQTPNNPAATPAPVQTQPASATTGAATDPSSVPPSTPAPVSAPAPAPEAPATVAPAVIPMVAPPPSTPIPSGPSATPVATPPGMEIPATVPVGDKEGGGSAPPSSPATAALPAAGSLDELKALYDRVRAQPLETAELDVAIAQFERFKSTLGSTPRDAAVARQIDAYTQAMKIRRDLRNLQMQNAAAVSGSELLKSDLGRKIVELERQRVYTVIGRLVRSTVYDGDRAPVLYRVMSPEPGSARTLGYLLPDGKFDYTNKLGQVVGIIGDLRPDEAMRTNLIIPKRVDVVSLAPIVVSPDIPGLVVPRPGGPSPAPAQPSPTPTATPTPAPIDPSLMPSLPSRAAPGVTPPTQVPAPTPAPATAPEKP